MKRLAKAVDLAQQAGVEYTLADIVHAYKEHVEEYGEVSADLILKRTLKTFKDRAKREQKRLFSLLRQECLEKYGAAPANKKSFKVDVLNHPDLFDTPAVQEYKKRFIYPGEGRY